MKQDFDEVINQNIEILRSLALAEPLVCDLSRLIWSELARLNQGLIWREIERLS